MRGRTPLNPLRRSRFRSRSLLWTFGGAFLTVLILWLVLQVVLLLTVVEPLVAQQRRAQIEALAESCASAIAARGEDSAAQGAPPESLDVRPVLRTFQGRGRDHLFFYESQAGWSSVVPGGGVPEPIASFLSGHLGRTVPGDGEFLRSSRSMRAFGRGWTRGETRSRDDRGDGAEAPGAPVPGDALPGPPGRWPRERLRVVSAPVGAAGNAAHVHVVYFERGIDLPREVPRPGLLFIPLAALLSGLAGFWLFRGVSGRLRILGDHASRVAAGELEARVPDLGGDEIGALGRALDEMTARLEESRRRLGETERQRKQFLADVTHDLSTPLTSIRGFAETLLDPEVPVSAEERAVYVGHILEESRRMDRLVRDLLDLARLEADAVQFTLEPLDLADLVRRHLERRRDGLARQGWELRGHIPLEPVVLRADGGRIEQLLDNLIENATRHAGAPGVLDVHLRPDATEVSLVVEDRGPGFPPEELGHVFDRFYRGERSRPAGGSGLGLAIVREIARRHGGEVHAENRDDGSGARIVLRLVR